MNEEGTSRRGAAPRGEVPSSLRESGVGSKGVTPPETLKMAGGGHQLEKLG